MKAISIVVFAIFTVVVGLFAGTAGSTLYIGDGTYVFVDIENRQTHHLGLAEERKLYLVDNKYEPVRVVNNERVYSHSSYQLQNVGGDLKLVNNVSPEDSSLKVKAVYDWDTDFVRENVQYAFEHHDEFYKLSLQRNPEFLASSLQEQQITVCSYWEQKLAADSIDFDKCPIQLNDIQLLK